MQVQDTTQTITKRDGTSAPFDPLKIYEAIRKAVLYLGGTDFSRIEFLTQEVIKKVEKQHEKPNVEDIQDAVEEVLMNNGHTKTAKAYIIYRQKRQELREERKKLLDGKLTKLPLSLNALQLLKKRYLQQADHRTIESPEELFTRVANALAQAETSYGGNVQERAQEFYDMMVSQKFLPNSPTLTNAGLKKGQLLSGYAIPVNDSLTSITKALSTQALVQDSGAGTGFNFSKIRPKGDYVRGRPIAQGPTQFMKLYDLMGASVIQGGIRPGSNMGIMHVNHPDILHFITHKQDGGMTNFNISVGITDDFMNAVKNNSDFPLQDPHTKKIRQRVNARHIWDLLILNAWKTGDPGLLFIDTIKHSRSNPLLGVKELEATSPCGEQPLYANEGSMLGAINLAQFCHLGTIDWESLRETVRTAIRLLDNALDVTEYPSPEMAVITKQTRRIGLGVMGFADLLFQLEVPYDSEDALQLARRLMSFISDNADKTSQELAEERGAFPYFNESIYKHGTPLRNATRTTLSPTGCMSIIAGCSPASDPVFALSYTQRFLNKEVTIVNEYFEATAHQYGFHSNDLLKEVTLQGSIQHIPTIPSTVKNIYKVAYDIAPEWQIKMQAAFQDHVDNAISKTINFPSWATTKDVEEVFMKAYQYGCKGITIYRDKSKENQVINVSIEKEKQNETTAPEHFYCPACNHTLIEKENAQLCTSCGFSKSKM